MTSEKGRGYTRPIHLHSISISTCGIPCLSVLTHPAGVVRTRKASSADGDRLGRHTLYIRRSIYLVYTRVFIYLTMLDFEPDWRVSG